MNLKLLTLSVAAIAMSFTSHAQDSSLPAWHDPEVVQVNREPMSATFDTGGLKISLSGVWKFNWNETADSRPMDFFETGKGSCVCKRKRAQAKFRERRKLLKHQKFSDGYM